MIFSRAAIPFVTRVDKLWTVVPIRVKVFNTINQLNSNKSCGFDKLKTKFVKIAAEIIAFVQTNLYNHCFVLGFFPSCREAAKVIPVFKSGEFQKLTNYRPISGLSCFSKYLEKLVHSKKVGFISSIIFSIQLIMGFVPIILQFMRFWI